MSIRLRSLLYIPGNNMKMLSKMTGMMKCPPDAFVADLEDSVPLDSKDEARRMVSSFLSTQWREYVEKNNNVPLMIPRVNHTEMMQQDIMSIVCQWTHGINVGKVETVAEMKVICDMLDFAEKAKNLRPNSIKLIPSIETALGLVNSHSIATYTPRNIALCFGGDDFANDMGFTRDTSQPIEVELNYARNVIAIAAKAANLPGIDTPNVNFKDVTSLEIESKHVKRMGFKGKFSIHPSQIETLNSVFGVSREEYHDALEIVNAWELAKKEGRGSTSVNGRMVDIPVWKRALQVVSDYE